MSFVDVGGQNHCPAFGACTQFIDQGPGEVVNLLDRRGSSSLISRRSSKESVQMVDIKVIPPSNSGGKIKPHIIARPTIENNRFTASGTPVPYVEEGTSPREREERRTEGRGDNEEGDLNRIINLMANKQQDEELINEILQDWKLLAQKVDYVLFWVFLCLTTISSSLFIFVLPYYNRGKLL